MTINDYGRASDPHSTRESTAIEGCRERSGGLERRDAGLSDFASSDCEEMQLTALTPRSPPRPMTTPVTYAKLREFVQHSRVLGQARETADASRSEAPRLEAMSRVQGLQASAERRFADELVEAMPGIFYLYDEQGRFLRWNQNFELVTGYSGKEIATMHPLDFFGPEEKALLSERIALVFEQGEATVEASIISKRGQATPYFFTGKRIEIAGAPCLAGVGVDITERKRAEETLRKTEERYRSTLDTILEGCQLIGFDWRYLYLNPAAEVQSGRPNSELLGRKMHDV